MAECVHLSISSFNRTSFSWKHPYTPPGEYGPAWYRCNTMNNTQESNIVCSSQWAQTGHRKYWSRDMWRGYTIYRPTAGHCLLCMCFRENQENIALFKSDNDSTYSNAVVAIFENGSYTAYIHLKAEWMGNWELHFQTVHDMLPCLQHLVTHTTCNVYIRIRTNDASSGRNSSRCPLDIHGMIRCVAMHWHVLGRIVHTPNDRARAYEKY